MWRGIAEAARDYGVNLVYLAGEDFESAPQAVLYDLIGEHNVDGIIVWNTFVGQQSSLEKINEFINWYNPLPMVSVEFELEGCANLMVDNDQGVRDLLAHLIEGHGYQKIAFIGRANSHASNLRKDAFIARMQHYGLLDPALVGSLEELDARRVRWGRDVRAVMAHSDYLAITLVDAFRQRGLRVPEDVVVVGFNDGQEARGSLPPLTTVRLPFRSMGRKAVELLVKRIGGDNLQDTVFLAPQLILRRSCGCLEPMAEQAASGGVEHYSGDLPWVLEGLRRSLPEQMAFGMGTSIESLALVWAGKLIELFANELTRKLADPSVRVPAVRYLHGLNDLLREAVAEGSNVTRWHESLTILRLALLPYLAGDLLAFAEDLFNQARVLVGQIAVRLEVHRAWNASRRTEILREIEAGLLVAFEFDELIEILRQGLARLKINDAYLVLYEDQFDPQGKARLALAVENGERVAVPAGQEVFAVQDLLPSGMLAGHPTYCVLVEGLQQREEQLGYLLFKTDPPADPAECDVYQALRIQVSGALKSVRLRQKLDDARRQAEEANHLKSRFLSMVSHELRTPINLIVGLSEMAMRQQSRGTESLSVLLKFLEQIYVSGQHLDRLIRDVLDLASSQVGQMNLISKPLELRPVLEDAACMGEQLASQKNLAFRIEVPPELPMVLGDKTRLRQILLNLLSNAVKFTAHGEIALLVSLEGSEILVSVRDTGLGIARQEQAKIFDEFHQSDRSLERGYGGIGLGLAITRRLVEMHGGRIWVSSSGAEGGGSTFSFTLPVLVESEIPQPAPALPALTRQGMVLIVSVDGHTPARDGTETAPRSLANHLAGHGFRVEEAHLNDAQDFIDTLVAAPPGAMVLDLAPASEQGWEIVKRIKEHPATQDIPVLFYALMQDEEGDTVSGTVLEMDYLTKPVGADHLVRALKRHGLLNSSVPGGRTILIVDDEPGILDLHARLVQTELPACRVVTARNGQEGLEKMRVEQPDLVLLDLMMPELDGFGVLKTMQTEELLRNIPVIVLSGQVLTRREMLRLNQGVAAVLGKGLFTGEEIVTRIESALTRSKRMGGEVQRLVQQAMAFIHEHYKEPISRADVANHLSINEQYLSRCFNKELGIGPMVYLSRYRIQRARRLLEMGNLSITQVAMEVGMSSQSYFSRVFQEELGITPSAYQRGVRPVEK
jgi:signal transduction histidine kinase/DNA-binding LacI/PurR family transcriptional regulator/DNA-binding response OmpR family regulator